MQERAYRIPLRDTNELRELFVETWAECYDIGSWHSVANYVRLIGGEKDWKLVSMQKVVTLNTCCDVACLPFRLPHITTGSFQRNQHLDENNTGIPLII